MSGCWECGEGGVAGWDGGGDGGWFWGVMRTVRRKNVSIVSELVIDLNKEWFIRIRGWVNIFDVFKNIENDVFKSIDKNNSILLKLGGTARFSCFDGFWVLTKEASIFYII